MTRPTVPEVLPLVNAYYAFPGCGCGGSLHIVLDDENIDDGSIEYCITCARDPAFWVCQKMGGPDEAGEALGNLLLLMSRTQRLKIAKWHDGYGSGHQIDQADFIAQARQLFEKHAPRVEEAKRTTLTEAQP